MTYVADLERLAKRLGVERRKPTLFSAGFVAGVPVEPLGDVVLRELAEFQDHREYEAMWRTPEVFDPWRHMCATVLSEPFEIQAASSSPAAQLLADQAKWIWRGLTPENRSIILHRLLDAEWFGWRPMQVILATKTWSGPGGRSELVVPSRIVDKRPHHFRWTTDQDRSLVFNPGFSGDVDIFSPEEVRAGWLCPRVGSLDDPYGRGLAGHCWLMWRTVLSISRRFYQGVDREWNMIHLKAKDPAGGSTELRAHIDKLADDIRVVTEMLAQKNILIDSGHFETTFLDKLQFIDSGVKLLQHVKTCLQTLIEGQTLTSETRTAGPAGSSAIHQEVKSEYAKATIGGTVEAAVSQMFANSFWLNFGEVDPADLPSFVSWLRLRLNVTTARALYDMHIPMRGRRMAQLLGAESVVGALNEIEAEDEILIQKPMGVPEQEGESVPAEG